MARSYKKHPICGMTTASSDKQDKRCANRCFRRKIKSLDLSQDVLPELKEVSNVNKFDKDGKQYCFKDIDKIIRK